MTSMKTKEVSILLVEDDDVDAMGIERALRKLRIANPLIRTTNGIDALQIMRSEDNLHRPYIVLLDLNMPLMNGLEFLKEIRNDPILTTTVVFVLTTSKADEDMIRAYQSHVAGYIVKNNIKDGFLDLIEMLDRYWKIVALPDEEIDLLRAPKIT